MTEDDFQRLYHDWDTADPHVASAEARKVNANVTGFTVSAVYFEEVGRYQLMLDKAIDGMASIGIVLPRVP